MFIPVSTKSAPVIGRIVASVESKKGAPASYSADSG
jgi:hypothetical protein